MATVDVFADKQTDRRTNGQAINCMLPIYRCKALKKKTLREKEKLLVTSNFSFSLNVFHKPQWFEIRILNIVSIKIAVLCAMS